MKVPALVTLLLAFSATLCVGQNELIELAVLEPDLSRLVDAVILSGLEKPLLSLTTGTILAPTNDAFESLSQSLNMSDAAIEQIMAPETLFTVLMYHIIDTPYRLEDLSDGQVLPTTMGDTITVSKEDNTVLFLASGGSTPAGVTSPDNVVNVPDVVVVHKIDQILIPAEVMNTISD